MHTLDYPPSFAFFEYFLSNNPITKAFVAYGVLDGSCFALLGDAENDVGMDCVIFQRCTVILADAVFILGAMALSRSLFHGSSGKKEEDDDTRTHAVSCTVLVVANSGIILLDHIHFQYNGMLLGILMASLACLLQSMKSKSTNTESTKLELLGAITFAFLLTFKHLYLTLAPIYFFYLLRRFCFEDNGGTGARFVFPRLVLLGSAVVITLLIPFLPFIMDGKDQMLQMLSRLFPFQRGLCHDYWAGNVWAIYLFMEKIANFLSKADSLLGGGGRGSHAFVRTVVNIGMVPKVSNLLSKALPFPEITPLVAAILLFIGLTPAMYCAWKIASNTRTTVLHSKTRQEAFLYCTVYSSITSFMLAYHVHEKAIMTAIVPMTFLAFSSKEGARLFLRMSAVGQFGLLPLLYKPTELLIKILLNLCYLVLCIYILETVHSDSNNNNINSGSNGLLLLRDKIGLFIMGCLLTYTEVIHGSVFDSDEMQFLPLMLTSLYCALGLFGCWIHCGKIMLQKVAVDGKIPPNCLENNI